MRKLMIALAGATALTAASAANAAVTIGATGSSCTGVGGAAGTNQIAVNNGTGTSLGLTSGTLVPGTVYTFQYTANLATRGNISGPANFYTAAAVPEPATWGLMLLGSGGMGLMFRRRRRP